MTYKLHIYVFFLVLLSSCSTKNNNGDIRKGKLLNNSSKSLVLNTSTKLDCNKILLRKIKVRNSLLRYCKEKIYTCSSSEARSSALHRLWKLYGKKDVQTPYQVISENKVWVVKGSRYSEPSKIVHVIIPKKSKNCAIKDIFHKRNIHYIRSFNPGLKKASDYKCPSHIVSKETCKKLVKFQNR